MARTLIISHPFLIRKRSSVPDMAGENAILQRS